MMTIEVFRRTQAWLPVLALGLLSACGGGGDSASKPVAVTADVTSQVPTAAATQADVATAYTSALASTAPSQTGTLEPVTVPASLATSDTSEPV